jgi:hypothetical protein
MFVQMTFVVTNQCRAARLMIRMRSRRRRADEAFGDRVARVHVELCLLERDLERMLLERNWSAHSPLIALNRPQPELTDLLRPGNSAFSLVRTVAVACLGVKGSQVQILSSRRRDRAVS